MQKDIKEKIKILIEKYGKESKSGELKYYKEEQTKKDFIEPFFEALGWNMRERNEVSVEESMSSGRVDYGFYINDRIKFYLEAKSLKDDIHKEEYARQAIKYSWNKGATWAILTNFETLIVFNAQNVEGSLSDKRLFEINCEDYLKSFDRIWLLSKEAFNNDLLDKEALKWGKKIQKVSVSAILYKDLQRCREKLTKVLSQCNAKVNPDIIDEGVQKLLDRLIFIRVAEDRGIEQSMLRQLVRDARISGKHNLYQAMSDKFRELDGFYNSNLFEKHTFEDWEEYGGATAEVVEILYGKEGYYEYDFKAMSADVLGAVYENYLSHRLSKSRKGTTVSKDAGKRKEQGIYYTPSFIVDYIVKNALGPVLDKCKTISDIKKIKVLDPACGSGSFLIKAFNTIFEKYKNDFNFRGPEDLLKIQILEENIYGVDLDPQAVEITRLNLLISALTKREKMPLLDNIKNGNSLISGTDEELEKYFGKNFRDKKPFNWQEEFPEVFKQGGFDVIIGNPPYVTTKYGKISDLEKNFYIKNFECAYDKLDLYVLFIERSIKILKENGFVSFVTPWNFLANFYSFKIRKFILDNTKIKLLYKLPPNIFGGAIVDNIIFVLGKDKNNKNNEILLDDFFDKKNQKMINQDIYLNNEKYVFSVSRNDIADQILCKMKLRSAELGDIALNYIGIMTGGQKEMIANKPIFKNSKPVLSGKDINRWTYLNSGNFVNFDKSKIHSNDNEKVYLSKKKILLRKTGRDLIACMDTNQFYTIQSLYNIVVKDKKYKEEYLLSLLNSKLFTYIYNKFFITNPEVFPYIKRRHLDQLPIKIISESQQNIFIKLTDKMLELNKDLQKTTENSEKWNSIKSEIEKTDKKIDEEVYKLYNLTEEEIKIVESSVK